MMRGTPAMTWTLPMENPGATEISLSIRLAPRGMVAMRWRAALNSPGL